MKRSLILVGLFLSGCTVGPDYQRPETIQAKQFVQAKDDSLKPEPVRADWWQLFHDPLLIQLIEAGLQENHDLRIAVQNLTVARARLGDSRWQQRPRTALAAQASRTQTSQEVSSANQPVENRYTANFSISWELDVFGRGRRLVESATADLAASQEDLHDAQVMVSADIAFEYLNLRAAQYRRKVANDNAEIQRQTVALTEALLQGGQGNAVDVQLARAQLATTQASIPVLEADIQQSMHRIAVLTGQQPTALREQLSQETGLPALPSTIQIGTPYRLLQRRPDVRAAERRLAATTARVGVATADLYPRFDLAGLFGAAARELGSLSTNTAETWRLGLGVTWPAFDFRRAQLAVEISEAEMQAQQAHYQQSVLLALEETETGLVRFLKNRERLNFARQAAQASQSAAELSRERFQAGASGFLSVLEAETRRLAAEDRLAQAEAGLGLSLVSLYRVLGGGWSDANVALSTQQP